MGKKGRKGGDKASAAARKAKVAASNLIRRINDDFAVQNYQAIVTHVEGAGRQDFEAIQPIVDASPNFVEGHGAYRFQTGASYMKVGNFKEAIVNYEKAIEISKKHKLNRVDFQLAQQIEQKSNNVLVDLYLQESRCAEAAKIVKKQMPSSKLSDANRLPQLLGFFSRLIVRGESKVALELAEGYLKDHMKVGRVFMEGNKNFVEYNLLKIIGQAYQFEKDFHKAIEAFERIWNSCPFEMSISWKEADICANLGRSYAALGKFEKVQQCLDRLHVLSRVKERPGNRPTSPLSILTERVACVADIHYYWNGHEEQAIGDYQRSLKLLRTPLDIPKNTYQGIDQCQIDFDCARIHQHMGTIHRRTQSFDQSIKALENSIHLFSKSQIVKVRETALNVCYHEIARTYLEQYLYDENLLNRTNPDEGRREILTLSLDFSKKALNLIEREPSGNRSLLLDMAQQYYLIGNREEAHKMLKKYLDFALLSGPSYCQDCHQKSHNNTMQVCGGCKVACYCSETHQGQAWNKIRTGHRKLCPLFSKWRQIKKGKKSADSFDVLIDKYFESTFKKTLHSRGSNSASKNVDVVDEGKTSDEPVWKCEPCTDRKSVV